LQRSQGIPSFGNEYRRREPSTQRLTGEYLPVDYAMVARGYGGNGYTAVTAADLEKSFGEMKAGKVSSVIDVKTLPGTMTDGYNAWWRVGTAQVSKHASVEAAARDIKAHVEKARQY
jgi:3D-(3,5/4)-trihydroxycyclohexane-1,2-dione acylhydrolase (decyclizing)